MFFIRFILLFLLFVSVIRIVYECGRLIMCIIAERHFETNTWSSIMTTVAAAYIMTIITCGFPV